MNAAAPRALPGFMLDAQAIAAALGPVALRVVQTLTNNLPDVPDMTITDVAKAAGASEPTVARVCQALGFSGFRAFRIAVARSGAERGSYMHADVEPNDTTREIAFKVIDRAMVSLERMRSRIDARRIDAAVDLLVASRRIEFYGHGNSGIVAADAQHKFFRLGIPCVAYSDSHLHAMAAAVLTPGDVVVTLSRSGRTRELIRTAEILKERKVSMIALTAVETPLARLATVHLPIEHIEDPDSTAPTFSRMLQLAMVDILAISVAMQRGPGDMAGARSALKEKRIP